MDFKKLFIERERIREDSPLPLPSINEEKNWLFELGDNYYSNNFYKNEFTCLQPRGGLSNPQKQSELWNKLVGSGADILPLTIDSNTRLNDYQTAERLYKESLLSSKDTLNGYPLIAIPYRETREIIKKSKKPISLRHGTPDARLLIETALTCGITEIEGGALSYCLPYSKNYPIDMCISNWRYIDRVCSYYNHLGLPIYRESFGPLTSTLIPPIIILIVEIIELVLAAEEGVKYFSVSITQSGNLNQDIATMNALRRLSSWIMEYLEINNLKITFVYHQWMGAFPTDRVLADSLLSYSTLTGLLCNSNKIILKTRDEALGVPSLEANSDAVKAAKFAREKFVIKQSKFNSEDIDCEENSLFTEVVNFFKKYILEPKDPTFETIYNLMRKGCLDIPFSPHIANHGLLSARRAKDGSIRIMNKGNVPFSENYIKRELDILYKENHHQDESLDDVVGMILNFAKKSDLK